MTNNKALAVYRENAREAERLLVAGRPLRGGGATRGAGLLRSVAAEAYRGQSALLWRAGDLEGAALAAERALEHRWHVVCRCVLYESCVVHKT